MLPTKFQFIWESGFRGEVFFRNQPIRNKNGLWQPCLLTDRDEMRPKKNICVFTVTCQKNLGSAFFFFITIGKTGNSRSRFRNPIFHFRNFR